MTKRTEFARHPGVFRVDTNRKETEVPFPAVRSRRLAATLGAILAGAALAGAPSAQAMCPRDQICEPSPSPARPDLVIVRTASNSALVKNIGNAPAGPFTVRLTGTYAYDWSVGRRTLHPDWGFRLSGLKAGESQAFAYSCSSYKKATADHLGEVIESKETNNELTGADGQTLC